MTPHVSVVIPTWNGADLLVAALRSLASQTWRSFETIVVDNGSDDGTAAVVAAAFPDVRILRFDENRGFASAVNAGIELSTGSIIVLMNNDVEAEPGWLAALVTAFESDPGIGSCASKMLFFDDRGRIDSAGDQLGLFAWAIGHGMQDGPAFAEPRDVLSPCAGAAAYRREALEQAGLFDERFFAYLEDVDLGVRLQLAGWTCRYVPDAVVYHHGSATARRMPELKLYLLLRNSLYLFFQYMPARIIAVWGAGMLLWPFWRVGRERQRMSIAWRAVRDFFRDAPAVLGRRSQVRHTRKLTAAEFRSRLTSSLI